MSKKIIIGVDIGLSGGLVIQNIPLNEVLVHKMPLIGKELDMYQIQSMLSKYSSDEDVVVVMENIKPIFGIAKSADFSLGRQLGIFEALCVANNLSYLKVDPKDWQKMMFQGIPEMSKLVKSKNKRDTKAMALVAAKRLFPSVNLVLSGCSKPHDGIVDALLISEYGRRQNI